MGGARVAGVIVLVLAAASLVIGVLNRFQHFIPLRSRWFVIAFVVLLIVGIFLVLRRAGSAQPAAK
jgi:predicted tellurium resistance membrane protein TerC